MFLGVAIHGRSRATARAVAVSGRFVASESGPVATVANASWDQSASSNFVPESVPGSAGRVGIGWLPGVLRTPNAPAGVSRQRAVVHATAAYPGLASPPVGIGSHGIVHLRKERVVSKPRYDVWAIRSTGDEPELRLETDGVPYAAIMHGGWIARQSGQEGAVSVWVQGPEGILWAAGRKARELEEAGYEVVKDGHDVGLVKEPQRG